MGKPADLNRWPFVGALGVVPFQSTRMAPARQPASLTPYNQFIMKAHVYVTLKPTVLDAQGQTVAGALRRMDFQGVADVRQGKYFLITLDSALAADRAKAQAEVERIAREVLINPVIEEFTFQLEG